MEFVRCCKSFAYFAQNYLKLKTGKPIPFYSVHERLIDHYDTNRFSIVKKFRGSGFSTYTLSYMLWNCMFKCDQRVMMLSPSDQEAVMMGEVLQNMLDQLPSWFSPTMFKSTSHIKHFDATGSQMFFYEPAASCGKAMDWLVIDEAAFIKNMDTHWKAMWPTLSCGGRCVAVSTVGFKWDNPKKTKKNWFYQTHEDCFKGKNKFKMFQTHYKEHPDYQDQKECDLMRQNLGATGWRQEIECEFLDSPSSTA